VFFRPSKLSCDPVQKGGKGEGKNKYKERKKKKVKKKASELDK
jgi:hypothetical protein